MQRAGHARAAWIVASLAIALPRVASAQDEPSAEPVDAVPLAAPPAPAEPLPEYGPPPPPPSAPRPLDAAPDTSPPTEPTEPTEPRAARFGDAGEYVITADTSIGLSSTEYSNSPAKYVQVTFSPGFDYFAVRGFSIGLDVGIGYSYQQAFDVDGLLVETTSTSYGLGPRFGFNVPLTDSVSFYPRLTIGINSRTQDRKYPRTSPNLPAATSSTTQSGGYVVLFTPLLFHPAPHFFLGAGPGLFREFGTGTSNDFSGGERTNLFASMVVGGWWGGKDIAPAPPPSADVPFPPPAPRRPRLGDDDTWVFTGDLGASIGYSTYGDSDRTSTSVRVSPGVDYFVVQHVSLGVAGLISRSSSSSTGQFGAKSEAAATTVGASGRVGVDIPLGASASLYPRGSVAVGHTSYDAKTLDRTADYAATNLTVALYVPLLVHIASHAFVGFGPSLTHDLTNTVEDGDYANLGTSIGAQLTVGGWLSR